MAGDDNNPPPGPGQAGPPYGTYPPPQQGGYPPSGGAYPPGGYGPAPVGQYPPTPKKRSLGKRILTVVLTIGLVILVRVGIHAVTDRHHKSPSDDGFDYAIGTCLDLSKTAGLVKPSDVHIETCSSSTALAKVVKKYKGKKNCPNDNYATLEGGGSGLCLQDNLTVGSCYRQKLLSHIFESSTCTRGLPNSPVFKVALRRDGADDPSLCDEAQQAVNYPEPPLTYCMDVLVVDLSRPNG